MQREIAEIIKSLIACQIDHNEADVAGSILSLKDRWPNLTDDEKQEIEAAAYAIYQLDDRVASDGTMNNVEFPKCLIR